MEELSRADLEAILRVAMLLFASLDYPTIQTSVLTTLNTLVTYAAGGCLSIDPATFQTHAVYDPPDVDVETLFEQQIRDRLWVDGSPETSVVWASDVATDPRLLADRPLRTAYLERGLRYALGFAIAGEAGPLLWAEIQRTEVPFTDRDQQVVGAFIPYVRAAWRGAHAVAGAAGDRRSPPAIPGLTRREHDVLRLLSDGKINGEIATELRLSTRTIDKHLQHIYRKLGVGNRFAAVARVAAHRDGQHRGRTPA